MFFFSWRGTLFLEVSSFSEGWSLISISIFLKIGLSLRLILILLCLRGVFLHSFCDKKVTRDTFWSVTGYFFLILARVTFDVTGYFWQNCYGQCHALLWPPKMPRVTLMSRVTSSKNVTGYPKKCHGEKNKHCLYRPPALFN